MRVPVPVRRRVHQDQLIREIIIISSPMRLGKGGRARLARFEINHHDAIRGRAAWRPRASSIVRVWVRS